MPFISWILNYSMYKITIAKSINGGITKLDSNFVISGHCKH